MTENIRKRFFKSGKINEELSCLQTEVESYAFKNNVLKIIHWGFLHLK